MSKSGSNFLLSLFSKLTSVKNTRYVNRFVVVKEEYPSGRSELRSEAEKKVLKNLQDGIENCKKMVGKYPFIKELEETVFVLVQDLDDLQFTIEVKNGEANVTIGGPADKKPTLVLPLYAKNLENFKEVTADGDIDLKEVYRFIRGLFVPFLRSLYQADYSNLPKDKSYLQLDNFIQVEVVNEFGVEVEGFPGPARATVVNVDGQWLIFEGFQGDPDVRYSMTLKQALEFAYLIKFKITKYAPTSNILELMPYVKKYNELKNEVTVYERKWHDVEELG